MNSLWSGITQRPSMPAIVTVQEGEIKSKEGSSMDRKVGRGFYTPLRDQHNPHVFCDPSPEELLLLEVLRHDRAAQRLNLSSRKKRRQQHHPDSEALPFLTNFAEILRVSPPPAPPALLRSIGKKENFSIGKVKVMLRIKRDTEELNSSFLNIDARKKQITIYDNSTSSQSSPSVDRRTGVSAPKMFAFDAIFSPDDTQAEVCSSSLPEVIQAVVGGTDGCLFVYGHSKQDLGTEGSGTSPGVYLRDDPIFGAQLINQSELRAPTAEKAAYLLDAALAARSRDTEDEGRNSHFLFTLHLYQYRVERSGKGGVAGGRSRLHLFDLGSCDKIATKPRDGGCLSLSALGNVILAIFNGQKHVPYKESKLTQLLKEAMGSLTCRVAMIAHISSQLTHYSEILGTIQLASRVHRMRRKKIKYANIGIETDEKGVCVRPYVRMHADENIKSGSSDPDYTSSSEQSCDTVIYVGHLSHGGQEFTDNEGPPSSLPIVPKLKQTQSKAHSNEKSSTLERKRHNSISKSGPSSEEQRKTEDKSSNLQNEGHHASSGKTNKSDKNLLSSKNSSSLQRHQPASTQTLGADNKSAQNSPVHVQKKAKHRTSQAKQDQMTDAELLASAVKNQSPCKNSKKQSDETWIDGPRFTKPKFDSKTLHQLQKEQWVDGPPNMYGFMDHHKQDMIQRWIEEHSRQLQGSPKKKKDEVWIDYPKDSADKNNSSSETTKNQTDGLYGKISKEGKNVCKEKHSDEVRKDEKDDCADNASCEMEVVDDEADSASNSADVDETDNEENAEASGYDSDLHILNISQNGIQNQSLCTSASANTFDISDDYTDTIEVYETDESVPMVDSCLQVTEEDILAEYWMQQRRKSSENPLPEVDQSNREHPLRILSEEGLNLPSSFTDSRSVSVDLDNISVPDTGESLRDRNQLTWRLLYGNMFQKIKEQHQQRRTADDLSSETNRTMNEKLERIARLRDLIQPLTRHRSQTKIESIFKTCPIGKLPSSGSRYTLPEILTDSRDSSMEDLSAAEVISTQSEPADLDIDKYDFKLNIKPMNGLKLEAYFRKIQKMPPFLEQYSSLKPTQIVPPLSYEQEKLYLLNKMETQRSESMILGHSNYKEMDFSSFKTAPEISTMESKCIDIKSSTSSLKDSNSTTHINKHLSTTSLPKESSRHSSSENIIQNKNQKISESSTELDKKHTDRKDSKKSMDSIDTSRRNEIKSSKTSINKNVDISQLTVGQSPSSNSKTRHRGKVKNCEGNNIYSEPASTQSSSISLWSKDTSMSSNSSKMAHRSGVNPNSSLRTSNKCHVGNGNIPNGGSKTSKTISNSKLPPRSSPTDSSTSGVTTTCCSTMKGKDKTVSSKNKSHVKQKQNATDSRKSQKNKSLCRSTSSPSTCVDSGDTAITDFTDSDHYHNSRHASVSGALASPYHKVPQVHVSHHHHHHHHHQRTSSGHGSESSVNSSEPREAKELLLKGTKTQQFSGTSSGYESMLRDSEGTPLSSSQESGNEDSFDKGERGRRGRRKSTGSSKRSSSAPARSPASPLGRSNSSAINQQPVSNSRSHRRGDRNAHRSDEEVGCTSLLCCRLLDFY
nr:uncharacterized protein LOC107440233 [Parasteatoda tepidariorum]